MKRIETPDGRFAAGDPATRKPGTLVTSSWMNAIQDEVCNVIEGAGLVLDANNPAQLRDAIASMAGSAAAQPSGVTAGTYGSGVEVPVVSVDATGRITDIETAPTFAEPRHHSVIDLTGLSTDRYYPVWWRNENGGSGVHKLEVARVYFEDKEMDPFGDGNGHLAGLTLELEGVSTGWGGNANFLHIKRIHQRYRKTVRNIALGMKCSSVGPVPGYTQAPWANSADCPMLSGLYLRGGLTYHFYSNQAPVMGWSREAGEVEVYSEIRNDGTSGRWMVKSHDINDPFLGEEYEDMLTPYGDNNYAPAAHGHPWSEIADKPVVEAQHKGGIVELAGATTGASGYGTHDAPAGYVFVGVRISGWSEYHRCKKLEVAL